MARTITTEQLRAGHRPTEAFVVEVVVPDVEPPEVHREAMLSLHESTRELRMHRDWDHTLELEPLAGKYRMRFAPRPPRVSFAWRFGYALGQVCLGLLLALAAVLTFRRTS